MCHWFFFLNSFRRISRKYPTMSRSVTIELLLLMLSEGGKEGGRRNLGSQRVKEEHWLEEGGRESDCEWFSVWLGWREVRGWGGWVGHTPHYTSRFAQRARLIVSSEWRHVHPGQSRGGSAPSGVRGRLPLPRLHGDQQTLSFYRGRTQCSGASPGDAARTARRQSGAEQISQEQGREHQHHLPNPELHQGGRP